MPLLELLEGVAEAAGLDGAAGGVGAGVEEEDDGVAFEVGEGDFFAVLVLEGEVFDFVADLHFVSFVLLRSSLSLAQFLPNGYADSLLH